jgi:hypothetical protein
MRHRSVLVQHRRTGRRLRGFNVSLDFRSGQSQDCNGCVRNRHDREDSLMSPMSLKVLATLLNLHGPDASLTSENQGINEVLRDVQGQIEQSALNSEEGVEIPAAEPVAQNYHKKYSKTWYVKYYPKFMQ